jgi:ankyrin repeat protein
MDTETGPKSKNKMALFTYIRRKQIKKSIEFIRDPKNHSFLNQVDANGDTPLIFACNEGIEEIALELVFSDQVDKSHVSGEGLTALISACDQEIPALIRALIQNNQSLHEWVWSDTQLTALLILCKNEMEQEAVQLINTGHSNPNHKLDKRVGAIHIASKNGLHTVVKSLIDTEQVNVGESDADGQTPLILACKNGYEDTALLLIQTGESNISYMDNDEKTALDYARSSRLHSVITILTDAEARQILILKNSPQYISVTGMKQWIQNNKHHRTDDRPAVIRPDGTREYYYKGTLHRIGAPAIVTENKSASWVNEGIPLHTITPDKIKYHPYEQKKDKENIRYVCVVYLGHARLSTKTTAHGIPSIVKRETPIRLNIASMAAPTEECVWPLNKFGDFRRYIEAFSIEFMDEESSEFLPKTAKNVKSFFEKLVIKAQQEAVGRIYGKEWLVWANHPTDYPGQQMQWNRSHHYAEKRYHLSEESRGQTGWFIMANNIGITPGSKLLLPGPYITTTELMRWFERAGVTHLHMVDVSCSSVYYPNSPAREIHSDPWIRRNLNAHTMKLNRSNSMSMSSSNSSKSNSKSSNSNTTPTSRTKKRRLK